MIKERPPQPERPQAEPDVRPAPSHETVAFGSPPVDEEPSAIQGKKIDPWRFGLHTVPPGMQATLLASPLPETPKDRLYRSPGPLPEDSGESAAPLATDEEVRIPKRDFRRPVLLAIGALLVVTALGVAVRLRKPNGVAEAQSAPTTDPTAPLAPQSPRSAGSADTVSAPLGAAPSHMAAPEPPVTTAKPAAGGSPEPRAQAPKQRPHSTAGSPPLASSVPAHPTPVARPATDPHPIILFPSED